MSEVVTIFNPAIKATDDAENPTILLGIRGGSPNLLVIDTDGRMAWKHMHEVQVDWRFDFKSEKWVDGGGEPIEGAE